MTGTSVDSADAAKKQCEQCKETKSVECFRKVTNQYTGVHPWKICKECYSRNQKEERQKQWEAERAAKEEAERIAREQEQHRRQVRALELSIQANKRCPRCHQIQTNGSVWVRENGRSICIFLATASHVLTQRCTTFIFSYALS